MTPEQRASKAIDQLIDKDLDMALREVIVDAIRGDRAQLRKALGEFAGLLRRHGADSEEVRAFARQHKADGEFLKLAATLVMLKRAVSIKGR